MLVFTLERRTPHITYLRNPGTHFGIQLDDNGAHRKHRLDGQPGPTEAHRERTVPGLGLADFLHQLQEGM